MSSRRSDTAGDIGGARQIYLISAMLVFFASGVGAQEDAPTALPDLPGRHAATAALGERISIPSPAEYFTVLSKFTNPRWRTWYRELAPVPPDERWQVAAGVGMLLAEAHLATMARDGQRLRNVGLELGAYTKILGFGDGVAPRITECEAFAAAGNWGAVHLALEGLAERIGGDLLRQRDDDLATMVTLGLWVRALHVGSGVVALGEVGELSLAASGPGLALKLASLAEGMSEELRAKEPVAFLVRQTAKISRVWAIEKFEAGREFTIEEVKDTHERFAGILSHLSKG